MDKLYNFNFNKEKKFFYHSLSISCFSPLTSLYQNTRLYKMNNKNTLFIKNIKYLPNIFPQQVLFRYGLLHASTFCKDNFSQLSAFGLIGILQGGIQGHSNVYFAKKLNITKTIKIKNYFRGPVFSGTRVIVSQGAPFLLTDSFNNSVFKHNKSIFTYYFSLFTTSITASIVSHPLHCMQTFVQNNSSVSQLQMFKQMVKKHKWSLFYKGVESRIILLFLTNLFNDLFLKDIWCK